VANPVPKKTMANGSRARWNTVRTVPLSQWESKAAGTSLSLDHASLSA
jgi:hypothetical protein